MIADRVRIPALAIVIVVISACGTRDEAARSFGQNAATDTSVLVGETSLTVSGSDGGLLLADDPPHCVVRSNTFELMFAGHQGSLTVVLADYHGKGVYALGDGVWAVARSNAGEWSGDEPGANGFIQILDPRHGTIKLHLPISGDGQSAVDLAGVWVCPHELIDPVKAVSREG